LDLPDLLLAHVEAADEMGRDADIAEQGENMLGDPVVEPPLAGNCAFFLGIEGGRVVLEILDQRAGLGTLVEDLGLSFVDLAAAGHGSSPGTRFAHHKDIKRQTPRKRAVKTRAEAGAPTYRPPRRFPQWPGSPIVPGI